MHLWRVPVLSRLSTYRCHFAVSDRIIRAARVTRGEIRFTVGAADWTKFVPIAVAGSLAGRLEARESAEMDRSQDTIPFYVLFSFNLILYPYYTK